MTNVTLCRTKDAEREEIERQMNEWLSQGNKPKVIGNSLSARKFENLEFGASESKYGGTKKKK